MIPASLERSRDRLQCRRDHLHGYELSNIISHAREWVSIEQEIRSMGQMVSDELTDCLETLSEDAIHVFLNLQTEEAMIESKVPFWIRLFIRRQRNFPSQSSNLLVSPRRDGETFQGLEQDFRAHLAHFEVEKYYIQSHIDVRTKSDLLEDVESTPQNTSRLCLLHAFNRIAPFRSHTEAQNAIQDYSKRVSRLVSDTFLDYYLGICRSSTLLSRRHPPGITHRRLCFIRSSRRARN